MVIYTIGGGEIIYNIMQAVALCLNGGSGLLDALPRIGGLCGAFIAYYIIRFWFGFKHGRLCMLS